MDSKNIVFIRDCETCKEEFKERNSQHKICDICLEKNQINQLPEYIRLSLNENKNISLIGPAGCGKSFYIKLIALWMNHNKKIFDILCPTGSSAINVNGITYHSVFGYRPLGISGLFFNININNILNMTSDELHNKLKNPRYRSCYNRIKQLDCIIFDELV